MQIKSRKWFFIVSILVIVTVILPYKIYGFRLKDLSSSPERGDRGDDDDSDTDNSDDGGNDVDVNVNDKSSKRPSYRDLSTSNTKSQQRTFAFRKIVKIVHVDEDGSEVEEDLEDDNDDGVEFKFEKVHRSDFSKSQSIFKAIVEEEEKEEEAEVEEASQQIAFALPNIFSIFGFGKSTEEPEPEEESNGLINWFQSFIKSPEEKPVVKEPAKSESWITSYLNRWPFNVFISFEKPNPKIWIPPVMPTPVKIDDPRESLSQDHFEYLLYHFPNFVLKPSEISDSNCRNQILIFQRQLRGNKLWTLQMLDATAKFPSGILKGNTNQFGDFDSCTQIRTIVKINPETAVKIKGKYCLTHIDLKYSDADLKLPVHLAQGKGMWKGHIGNPGHLVPRYTTINWGICIPNQCSHKEIFKMIENTLKPYNSTGINFHIKVNEDDCFIRKSQNIYNLFLKDSKVAFTIGFYLTLMIMVVLATTADYWELIKEWASQFLKKTEVDDGENEKSNDEPSDFNKKPSISEDKNDEGGGDIRRNDFERIKAQLNSGATISKLIHEILLSFSLKRTLPGLINTDPEVDIVSLHALKVISTLMLYMFAKFLMLGHLSIINRDDMVKVLSNPLSILLRTPLIYLDTLLLIAGFLSSREMCKQLELKAKISVLRIIAGKLIRSLPTLFAVLFFQSWILPHLGSGPLWSSLVQKNAELCEKNLWRNFFGVQNFINVEESCSPFTTQLALDLQLLFIGCLIVWFYYNNEDIGFGIYGIFHAMSVAARYSHTHTERLSSVLFHGMNVSKFYRTANISYSSPIDRATAYLIGIGAGVLIWTSDAGELNLPFTASILAWTSSLIGIIWCFWYPWHNTKLNFLYDPSEAATYASWGPLFLSLSLAWIIFASSFTTLPLNTVLNSKPLIFLSRIAYPMQLVIFSVVIYNTALNKEPIRFETADLMNFGEIIIIICAGIALAIFIDYPFQNIRKILLETEFSMVSSHEEEDIRESEIDGDDAKGEKHEEDEEEEHKKDDTITEDIWGDNTDDTNNHLSSKKYERNSSVSFKEQEASEESWRTESDLEKYRSELISKENNQKFEQEEDEGDEIEEEDEREKEAIEENDQNDQEIPEEEDVIRRPGPVSSENTYRRRKWDFEED